MKRFGADLKRDNIPAFDGGIEEYHKVVNQVSQPPGYVLNLFRHLTTREQVPIARPPRSSFCILYLVYQLTLRLLMSYIYGAPSKARNANVVYIWTYVWQR